MNKHLQAFQSWMVSVTLRCHCGWLKSPQTKWRFVAGKIIELYIYGEDLPWPRSLQEGNANGDGDLVEQSVPPFTSSFFLL